MRYSHIANFGEPEWQQTRSANTSSNSFELPHQSAERRLSPNRRPYHSAEETAAPQSPLQKRPQSPTATHASDRTPAGSPSRARKSNFEYPLRKPNYQSPTRKPALPNLSPERRTRPSSNHNDRSESRRARHDNDGLVTAAGVASPNKATAAGAASPNKATPKKRVGSNSLANKATPKADKAVKHPRADGNADGDGSDEVDEMQRVLAGLESEARRRWATEVRNRP